MKLVLVVLSFLLYSAGALHENSVEDDSYETIRQSYSFLRATMAPVTESPIHNVKSKLKAMMKKECDRHGVSDAFDKFEESMQEYVGCIQSVVQTMEAPRTRDPNTIVRNVCRVSPRILTCFHKFLDGAKSCMAPEERNDMNKSHKAVDSLVGYLCYEDGRRIIDFISGGGNNCVTAKGEEISHCANSTLLKEKPEEDSPFSNKNTAEHCLQVGNFQSCLKGKLNECSTSAAADFADGAINSVKSVTCK